MNPRIVELDFGMGNIRSLQKAFEHIGYPVEVVKTVEEVGDPDLLLIPGDGAFGTAMENLHSSGFIELIKSHVKKGKPLLGICIGFQLLFEKSEEFSYQGAGLSLMKGTVTKFPDSVGIIPHMGWNKLYWSTPTVLSEGIESGSYFYFVHSYHMAGKHENATGVSDYGKSFTAIVEKDNITGLQFHPEKSDENGLQMLKNYMRYKL